MSETTNQSEPTLKDIWKPLIILAPIALFVLLLFIDFGSSSEAEAEASEYPAEWVEVHGEPPELGYRNTAAEVRDYIRELHDHRSIEFLGCTDWTFFEEKGWQQNCSYRVEDGRRRSETFHWSHGTVSREEG